MTSSSVEGGTSSTRLPEASVADQSVPFRAAVSHTVGASTPPTSLALTQPGPASRVAPSPLYGTISQSGLLSICLSRLHCGKRVKTAASSLGPERSGVSVWFLTPEAVRSEVILLSTTSPLGLRVDTTTAVGGANSRGVGVGITTTAACGGTTATAGIAAAETAATPDAVAVSSSMPLDGASAVGASAVGARHAAPITRPKMPPVAAKRHLPFRRRFWLLRRARR